MADLSKLETFRKRMQKLGIELQMSSNYPWIYIDSVNGNRIQRKDYFEGNHGFTVGFHPIRVDQSFDFTDITEIFKLIRKYR
jgi:hypothetical protein